MYLYFSFTKVSGRIKNITELALLKLCTGWRKKGKVVLLSRRMLVVTHKYLEIAQIISSLTSNHDDNRKLLYHRDYLDCRFQKGKTIL